MSTMPALEELTVMAGLTCGRHTDAVSRAGLVNKVLGEAIVAVLHPVESLFYFVGIVTIENWHSAYGRHFARLDARGQETNPNVGGTLAGTAGGGPSLSRNDTREGL
ncbi:MAG TPA: hypothetical protein VEI57_10575 [Nitrospirota bacterium]|nr:hypothetical protein [Nitrospirota bacterium]